MHPLCNVLFILAIACSFVLPVSSLRAGTPMSDRVAVEAGVRTELAKDLALPPPALSDLSGRRCLDGRPVDGVQGQVVEYWANLECSYCGIQEVIRAQREDINLCIVVRHAPAEAYGESLKKALCYEALHSFSVNAAHRFWDAVVPRTELGIPAPYEGILQAALQEAAIAPEAFGDALRTASTLVSADMVAARSRITSTPTYVLQGIRFPACDFTAAQLRHALELADRARSGDAEAGERIVEMITHGLLHEALM